MDNHLDNNIYEIKHPFEAAITSDLRAPPNNFALWDTETETQLVVFKGEKSPVLANCLQLIDDKHIITAHDNVLRIWSIVKKNRQEQKLILPTRPSALSVSPCGNYLIVGKQETLNIWQLSSGNLLTSVQRHYQTISVIKVCVDSSFIVTGGEDGIAFVWSMADLICGTRNISRLNRDQQQVTSQNEPMYSWQHHSSKITAIHLTSEGKNGRCITASTDETINIYSMVNGKRLANIMMPTAIWSVIMNRKETCAYLGGQNGDIYEIATNALGFSIANMQESGSSSQREPVYTGHKDKVTCLELSIDGGRLLSASLDSSCKIWNTRTKKLIRDLKHQGPVVNLKLLLIPVSLATSTQYENEDYLPVKPLRRFLHKPLDDSSIGLEELFNEEHVVYVKNDQEIEGILSANEVDQQHSSDITSTVDVSNDDHHIISETASTSNRDSNMGTQQPKEINKIQTLKKTIKDLYLLAAEKIFKDASHEALKPYALRASPELNVDEGVHVAKRKRLS